MNDLNSVLLEGNAERDPEFGFTGEGVPFCGFTVASSRWLKRGGGCEEKDVSLFDVETFGKLAETARTKVKKGRGVRVVGRLKQYALNDGEGGASSKVAIIAEHVEFKPEREPEEAA